MIKAGEIQKIASEQGVRDTQIEKDYIIGWILKGISQEDYLSQHLVFKGLKNQILFVKAYGYIKEYY